MSVQRLRRIRDKIRTRQYDMSVHAMDEMAEDNIDIEDIEAAVLNGEILRIERDDPRGTRYVIGGIATDGQTPVGVVGRFRGTERYLIITVYEITDLNR